jgi:hypothetical protein
VSSPSTFCRFSDPHALQGMSGRTLNLRFRFPKFPGQILAHQAAFQSCLPCAQFALSAMPWDHSFRTHCASASPFFAQIRCLALLTVFWKESWGQHWDRPWHNTRKSDAYPLHRVGTTCAHRSWIAGFLMNAHALGGLVEQSENTAGR